MNRTTKLYIALSADVEIEVSVTAREYNGMDSDPKVRVREPSLMEWHESLDAVNDGNFKFVKGLDFPEELISDQLAVSREEGGGK